MDTDLIFKRGVAYTLATSLILGGYFGVIALFALVVPNGLPQAVQKGALVLTILLAAAIFDPLRYDYRKALVEFGRGLSSETDLQALLESIVEQLPHTLLVERVAVFMAYEPGRLSLAASHGLPAEALNAQIGMDLGFLDFDHATDHSHIFLENAQLALHLPAAQQRARHR